MGGVGGVASHTSAHHAEVLNELDPKQGNGGNGVIGGLDVFFCGGGGHMWLSETALSFILFTLIRPV
jgi:hypothetical protein